MYSEFLVCVLTASSRSGGCGMSTRPAYYSGRGATTTDLDSSRLEKIWAAVQEHVGKAAAAEFVKMVASIPSLSATDFLLTLARLELNDWKWEDDLLGNESGIYVDSEMSAWGTVLEVFGGAGRANQTEAIRGDFLVSRKRGEHLTIT